MPPSTRRIARIRSRVKKHYLTQVCDIDQLDTWTGITPDTEAWTTVHSDVPCRLILQRQFARNEIIGLAGMEVVGEIYVLVLPREYALTSNTRVLVEGLYYDMVLLKENLTDEVFNLYVVSRQEGL